MRKFIGKHNERILCKLSKSEILRSYSVFHVFLETTKTSHFTCQSKSFISTFFTCQVSACELQPFSCHDLANDILTNCQLCSATLSSMIPPFHLFPESLVYPWNEVDFFVLTILVSGKAFLEQDSRSTCVR